MLRTLSYSLLAFCWTVFQASAQSGAIDTWKQFRAAYPYHIQVTALTSPSADGTRTLIVSEPPPHVTLKSIAALDAQLLSDVTVRKQKMGYDGWVADLVIKLPAMDDAQLRNLVDQVNYHLFGTTYKADALPLPPVAPTAKSIPLDLRVTSGDLNRWIIAENEPFHSEGESGSWTIRQLLQDKRAGVYLSDKPGVVAWILPRSGDYSRFRREARQFSVDSDLIVGAIASNSHLAVLARERTVPLSTLPPLRTETIIQLANVATASLAQSYERRYPLAGRFDGRNDWAPIYLSDNLIDTEYGSLLNLTDQLLKSWSMAGQIEYIDFGYPKPTSYPFPQALANMPEIAKAMKENEEGLTFNWNTNGAGYVDAIGDLRIYALNRTGALPISYLSGGTNSSSYEKDAYNWFAARTNDPNLARVVQYAALYQVFHEFRIHSGTRKSTASKQPKVDALATRVAAALQDIKKVQCSSTQHLILKVMFEDICDILDSYVAGTKDAQMRGLAVQLVGGRNHDDIELLRSVFERPKDERRAYVASLADDRRQRLYAVMGARRLGEEGMFREVLADRIPLREARDLYAAGALRKDTGWIRTASVVISWPTGNVVHLTGGHNLDARVGKFVEDAALKPGEVRIVSDKGQRVVYYSPADRGRLPEWLHAESTIKDNGALRRALQARFQSPVEIPPGRTLHAALHTGTPERAGRGLNDELSGTSALKTVGWGKAVEATPHETGLAQALKDQPARLLNIERFSDGTYRLLIGATGQVYSARSMTDVLDAVVGSLRKAPGKPPTKLILAGFDEGGAVNFRRTVEVWIQREGLPQRRLVAMRPKGDQTAVAKMFDRIGEHGDLQRAKFSEWTLTDAVLPSGKQGKVWESTIEVPAKVEGVRGFFLKIRIFFESLFPSGQEMAAAEAAVKSRLSKIGRDATADEAAAAVELELRTKFPKMDSVIFETTDLMLVRVPHGSKSPREDATASPG